MKKEDTLIRHRTAKANGHNNNQHGHHHHEKEEEEHWHIVSSVSKSRPRKSQQQQQQQTRKNRLTIALLTSSVFFIALIASFSFLPFWGIGTATITDTTITSDTKDSSPLLSWKPRNATLALLYPPGLLGGYRNQFIRFTSLVAHATLRNLTHLFLPSLLWSTTIYENNNSSSSSDSSSSYTLTIPMEYIFDIDAWNEYALATTQQPQYQQSQPQRLPVIVQEIQDSDCWVPWNKTDFYREAVSKRNLNHQNYSTQQQQQLLLHEQPFFFLQQQLSSLHPLQRASLQRGTINHAQLTNLTLVLMSEQNAIHKTVNTRRLDLLPMAREACTHPVVYGGGIMAGRLWNDHVNKYTTADKDDANADSGSGGQKRNYPQNVDKRALQALHPLPKWRQVTRDYCLGHNDNNNNNDNNNYLALHARVELEMLTHPCGRDMERNLTRIFQRVHDFLTDKNNENEDNDKNKNVSKVFVAVWRQGIRDSNHYKNPKWTAVADDNWEILNRYSIEENNNSNDALKNSDQQQEPELLGGRYRVLECGTKMMDRYYADHPEVVHHGTLLESVLNFDIAVQAAYFVGVQKSSYSTDIWTTRFHLGKGKQNYRYTKTGIEALENDGLPDPHGNCKKK